jgi:hypothetical protein
MKCGEPRSEPGLSVCVGRSLVTPAGISRKQVATHPLQTGRATMDAVFTPGTAPDASPPRPGNGAAPDPIKCPANLPPTRRGRPANPSTIKRAFGAADLALGHKPSIRQAAMLYAVPESYVSAAKRIAYEQPHLRSSVESGLEPLLAKRKRGSVVERLAKLMAAASHQERVAFVRWYGRDAMLDLIIAVEAA